MILNAMQSTAVQFALEFIVPGQIVYTGTQNLSMLSWGGEALAGRAQGGETASPELQPLLLHPAQHAVEGLIEVQGFYSAGLVGRQPPHCRSFVPQPAPVIIYICGSRVNNSGVG